MADALHGSYPDERFRVVLHANPYLAQLPSRLDFAFVISSDFVPVGSCGWVVRFHKLRARQASWPDPIAGDPQPVLAVRVGSHATPSIGTECSLWSAATRRPAGRAMDCS